MAENRIVYEYFKKRRIVGVTGFQDRMLEGWLRRGMRLIKPSTLKHRAYEFKRNQLLSLLEMNNIREMVLV